MKAMTYLVWANIKGTLRSIWKKKSRLIIYVAFIGFLAFTMFGNSQIKKAEQLIPDEYTASAFAAIMIVITVFSVKDGLTKGSSSYRTADVTFVFPSPVSPKLILIYGFLKQLGMSLMVVLFYMFQAINIRNIFGLTQSGFYSTLLPVFLLVLYLPVCSMFLYSVTLRREGSKKVMEKVFFWIALVFGLALITLTVYLGDPLAAAKTLIGGKAFEYVPIIGWFAALLKAAKWGFEPWTWTALGLLIAALAFIVWRLLASDVPFYEEVLKRTEERESLILQKRSGRSNLNLGPKKVRKASVEYKGKGTKAIYYRQLLEFKKAGFMFVDKITLIMLAVGIVAGFIFQKNDLPIFIAFYISIYLNFLFAFNGKWIKELSTPFIYIIPGSSMSKLWYATAANHIKHLLDGAAVFIPIVLITGADVIVGLGLAAAYAAIGALFVYTDVLNRRIFGAMYEGFIPHILKVMFILLFVSPAIAAFIAVTLLFGDYLLILRLAPIIIVVYCALISLLIMLFGKKLFSDTELV